VRKIEKIDGISIAIPVSSFFFQAEIKVLFFFMQKSHSKMMKTNRPKKKQKKRRKGDLRCWQNLMAAFSEN
jgi:hypothetical protein